MDCISFPLGVATYRFTIDENEIECPDTHISSETAKLQNQ